MKMLGVLAAAAWLLLIGACGSGGRTATSSLSPASSTVSGGPTVSALQTALAGAVNATANPAFGTPVVQVVEVSPGRRILTDEAGKTLYVLRDDVPATGVSNCAGECTATWPPLTVAYGFTSQTPGLGPFGQFLRPDGQRQVMYRGRPLYYYSGDKARGDMRGDGIDGRWSVAVP